MKGRGASLVLFILGALLVLGAAGITGYSLVSRGRSTENAKLTAQRLFEMMPEPYAASPDPARGDKEMSLVELDGEDYIGILEIPVHGVRLPIAAGWDKNSVRKYPCRFSGSVWDGTLTVGAGADHFSFAERVDAGTAVFVTDMCGRRFAYTVREVEIRDNAELDTLLSDEEGLTLFLRDEYTMEYMIVRCFVGRDG